MQRLGCFLFILGAGSFILPLFGLQFKLLMLFGDATPIVGVVLALVGLVLFLAPTLLKKASDADAAEVSGNKAGSARQ